MPKQKSELEFNAICWLLGHDVNGKIVAKSFRLVSGKITDGRQYYCKRCQNPDSFPIHQFLDRRNLYQRTIRVWISRIHNRWCFRNFQRDWEKGKEDYLRHLDEQLKKYSLQEPRERGE